MKTTVIGGAVKRLIGSRAVQSAQAGLASARLSPHKFACERARAAAAAAADESRKLLI